jgi:hypothetical protein
MRIGIAAWPGWPVDLAVGETVERGVVATCAEAPVAVAALALEAA